MKLIKMLKNCLLLFSVVLFTLSCKKDVLENRQDSVLLNNNDIIVSPFSAGDGNFDVLGAGYDITGSFANSSSSRQQVIDMNKLALERNDDIGINTHAQQYYSHVYGYNSEEYSRNLTSKMGLDITYNLFKGGFKNSFNEIGNLSNKYSYASTFLMIKLKRINFYTSASELKQNYLTNSFKVDVENLTPQNLIRKYGTHVLCDATLGGKLELNYKTESNTRSVQTATTAGLVLGVNSIFGVNIDRDVQRKDIESNFNQNLSYRTVGGDGSKGVIGSINLDGSLPTINVQNWQNSCTIENAALIDIGQNGLIPIQDLILSPSKKSSVENYINQYFEENKVKITDYSFLRYGRYKIINLNSGKVLAIPFGRTNLGEQAIQWSWSNGPEQQWNIEKLYDGSYKVTNANSNLALAIANNSISNGGRAIQWNWQNGSEQKWIFERNSDGSFKLKNYNSGQVLAISSNSENDGAKAIQWPWQNGSEQKWYCELIY
ncbi:RICIN domain-containing protein [Sphingobacterium sp. Mn56C]|uniref:RICIN domain-containing protein n=1 Tax=Sphingobacterium sp. Mn56C TaxID=3395261 RepID=UPI003BD03888